MELCPHLARRVAAGCSRIDRFAVLHGAHREALCAALHVASEQVRVVGAGYREDVFHPRGRDASGGARVLYVGKYSAAKGLPCLLDAIERLWDRGLDAELQVAGQGAGPEADDLRERMRSMAGKVVLHGQLSQAELAESMRRSDVVVLPSFYEGLPLVLVEAVASGCRVVATALPGIVEQLAPFLGDALSLVDPPSMSGIDTPVPDELPEFTARLASSIERALDDAQRGRQTAVRPAALEAFTWAAVFRRVEDIWLELTSSRGTEETGSGAESDSDAAGRGRCSEFRIPNSDF
jgi:glycosyltransferase involved in cell wall biosynthesis